MKKINWSKDKLIPAIVQDNNTGQVLMLAYMNRAALQKTVKTKCVWFYSRSKKRLWMKGEESGNKLSVVSCKLDCDKDALLIRVNPTGPTCHTGQVSCFGKVGKAEDALIDLFKIIQGRKNAMPRGSYTVSLFKAGLDRICTKIAEESGEVIKAATKESQNRLIEETADLLYHMMVLLAERDVAILKVMKELQKRMQ
jgi:phosphoribosyl-ATP pyrophosphohydrolase/phosphoribosyl-AMP cyclohydrolase